MGSVVIDQQKCSRCGRCCTACPHQLISQTGEGMIVDIEGCMVCGHCHAACPEEAIKIDEITEPLEFSHIDETFEMIQPGQYDCNGLVQLMRSRRSFRSYSQESVPLTLLEDLVKVGITAPSGTNSQAWNFVILPTRSDVEVLGNLCADFYRQLNRQAANPFYRLLARLFAGDALAKYYRQHYRSVEEALHDWDESQIDRLFHGATAAILVTGNREASCPAEDALLATQNILLAAHSLGLGSCLIGFAVEALRRCGTSRRGMAIPADEEIYSVIALGYPNIRYERVAGRFSVQPRVLHFGGGTNKPPTDQHPETAEE